MKQKGLPLRSNKAAPCTVLSHSLVVSAPHVSRTPNTQTHTRRQKRLVADPPHIWHKSHPRHVARLRADERASMRSPLWVWASRLLVRGARSLFPLCRDGCEHAARQGMCLDLSAFIFLSSFFSSVHPLPAFRSSAVAGCLALALHTLELIVETQLEDSEKGVRQFRAGPFREGCSASVTGRCPPPLLWQSCGRS